ncbi:MAG TPA: hypothetical protein VHN37_02760 [Actinomycetota bacterium]|nr:hypothetical protein [Actinomycetota bacterium]
MSRRALTRVFLVVVTGALLVLSALSEPAGTRPAAPGSRPDKTLDDLFADVAARVPAFGGVYVDEGSGQLRVQMAGPGRAAEAQRALVEVLDDPSLGDLTPVAIPADYTFAQLKRWYDDASPTILGMDSVTLGDIDERANRLRFGVEDLSSRGAVEDELQRHGVPLEAVVVEHVDAAVPETSIRDYHRPVVGGLQIQFIRNLDQPICTLGFNAFRSNVKSFVTASHCSAVRSSNEGTPYHQPLVGTQIGSEWWDPPFFTGTPCPAGKRCRFSDSLVGTYGDIATGTVGLLPRVALDSVSWNGSDVYRITSEEAPVVGRTVNKLGRNTGRTRGEINYVCVERDVVNSDIQLRCQSLASYHSDQGDSGGPVFRITNSPSTNDVALVGLHWGGGGQFSPIGGIQRSDELGPLNTCASGFSC